MPRNIEKKSISPVEVMIIIVIIGILIAIAVPLYNSTVENSNEKKCTENINEIKLKLSEYIDEHGTEQLASADIAELFEDGRLPNCPWDKEGSHADYKIAVDENGEVIVKCMYEGEGRHEPSQDYEEAFENEGILVIEQGTAFADPVD